MVMELNRDSFAKFFEVMEKWKAHLQHLNKACPRGTPQLALGAVDGPYDEPLEESPPGFEFMDGKPVMTPGPCQGLEKPEMPEGVYAYVRVVPGWTEKGMGVGGTLEEVRGERMPEGAVGGEGVLPSALGSDPGATPS